MGLFHLLMNMEWRYNMNDAYTPKARNKGNRKRGKILLIATEGDNKTEENYYKKFNRKGIHIEMVPGNETDPENMMKQLLKCGKKLGFDTRNDDRMFCVLDIDLSNTRVKQINEAKNKRGRSNIEIIRSNPCFEVWFLCHYIKNQKNYKSSNDVIEELKKYIPNYEKGSKNIYDIVCKFQTQAANNSKYLDQKCINNGKKYGDSNYAPATDALKVIEATL